MGKIDINQVKLKMVEYNTGDPKQIQHFMKVYGFASLIGDEEKLNDDLQEILEVAALVHDIGINPAMERYGTSEGKYQESEGQPVAERLLRALGYSNTIIKRVGYLVGHHHTFENIEGMDYQILVEADLLVNFYEHQTEKEKVQQMMEKIFRTNTGISLCKTMFGI